MLTTSTWPQSCSSKCQIILSLVSSVALNLFFINCFKKLILSFIETFNDFPRASWVILTWHLRLFWSIMAIVDKILSSALYAGASHYCTIFANYNTVFVCCDFLFTVWATNLFCCGLHVNSHEFTFNIFNWWLDCSSSNIKIRIVISSFKCWDATGFQYSAVFVFT